jgi:hypothetical protein
MEVLDEWVMWNLVSVCLGTVLVSVQIVCSECSIGPKIILLRLMILLGHEAQVEACLSPVGDSANLYTRYVCGLCRTYHRNGNHVGCP